MENQEVMQVEANAVEATEEKTGNRGVIGWVIGIGTALVGAGVLAYHKLIKPKKKAKTDEAVAEENPDAWKDELHNAATEEID